MRFMKLLGAGAASAAMLGMALPAEAQWHGPRRGPPPRHHRGDRVNGGDVLLGAVLAGGLFAVLASGKKQRQRDVDAPVEAEAGADEFRYDGVPAEGPVPVEDDLSDRAIDALPEDGVSETAPADGVDFAGDSAVAVSADYDEESAADRCAAAAEQEGQSLGRIVHVGNVSSVVGSGQSWTVLGRLEYADSYRDVPRNRNFRCTLRAGDEPQVRLDIR